MEMTSLSKTKVDDHAGNLLAALTVELAKPDASFWGVKL
jgi:hypothetical protein